MSALVDLTAFQLIGLFKRMGALTPCTYLTRVRLRARTEHMRRGLRSPRLYRAYGRRCLR